MEKKRRKQKWIKPRHRVVTGLLKILLTPYCRLRYGITVEPFDKQGSRPYLILLNHQTPFDQFFVGMAFTGAVYYLATEDLFSNGLVSRLINYLVAPIPIKKQTSDIKAVMNCIRVAREGGTIAIAPEGNRTYSGRTEYIKPSIVSLARKLNMPVALFRIEGGYGIQPRWSDVIRNGKMRAYVSRVIEPEEMQQLTDEQLLYAIQSGLYVNEATADGEFHHKKTAEYLERAIYVCPWCGLSPFESHNDVMQCSSCGRKIRYLPNKELQGIGFDFPHRFVAQWYDYQSDFVNSLNLPQMTQEPLFRDHGKMSEVILCKRKVLLHKYTDISLYGDRIEIHVPGSAEYCFPFAETGAVCVLGRNKMNIYFGEHVYQIYGGKRFNALKYVNFFHRYRNIIKGDENGKFLGL